MLVYRIIYVWVSSVTNMVEISYDTSHLVGYKSWVRVI